MSDYIPEHVLINNILPRLPAKTLLRWTSVCKSWRALITSSAFITTHLNLNLERPTFANCCNNLVLVRSCPEDCSKEQFSLHFDNEAFDEHLKLEFPLKSIANDYFRIVGSCRGLVCLSDDQFTYVNYLYLWNPSIRKVLALSRFRVTLESHGPFAHAIGFGFDPLSNDYKVVRIVYLNGFLIPPEVDVFSLSTGTWRNISHVGLAYRINERAPQAYLNGVLHWVASDCGEWGAFRCLIVSFHMGDEVFGELELPDIAPDAHRLHAVRVGVRVAVLRDSLCVIQCPYLCKGDEICSIWVMKEYGVAASWSKTLCIDLRGGIERIAGFRKNGEVLLAKKGGYDLVSYDPKTRKSKDLDIHCSTEPWYSDSLCADAYVESLVLLDVKSCDEAMPGEGSGAKENQEKERKCKDEREE